MKGRQEVTVWLLRLVSQYADGEEHKRQMKILESGNGLLGAELNKLVVMDHMNNNNKVVTYDLLIETTKRENGGLICYARSWRLTPEGKRSCGYSERTIFQEMIVKMRDPFSGIEYETPSEKESYLVEIAKAAFRQRHTAGI